jgi:hypothetical protein
MSDPDINDSASLITSRIYPLVHLIIGINDEKLKDKWTISHLTECSRPRMVCPFYRHRMQVCYNEWKNGVLG